MTANTRITQFRGDYHFLSNFYAAPVDYQGIRYENNEAAFQAQKQPERAQEFTSLSPLAAKRLGRQAVLRSDWEEVKLTIMAEVVYAKFSQNENLRVQLLQTSPAELIEGNHWGGTYWGVCNGKGKNELGKILMAVRETQTLNLDEDYFEEMKILTKILNKGHGRLRR